MSSPTEQFEVTLKEKGFSLTAARQSVFSALEDKEPQTIQQIVTACPEIDRTSAYRAIKLFEQLGIAQKLQIGWKYKIELTDQFHQHHHHLSCQRCGAIIDFDEGPELEKLLDDIAAAKQFEMRSHLLEIQGLCRNCRPSFA